MKTVVLAQAIISFTMALLMSGYATCLQFGFTLEWLQIWMQAFAMAWPVAFCLSLVVGRLGFALAHRILPVSSSAT